MHEEILATIKAYLKSIHEQDYDSCYELFDKDETAEYKRIIQEFAEKLDPFGEANDFLQRLNVESLEQMRALTDKEFMVGLLKGITKEIGKEELKTFVDSTRIIKVDATDYLTIVTYKYSTPFFDDWIEMESQITLIHKDERWQVIFKAGIETVFSRFEKEIDEYYRRKALDQPAKAGNGEHLTSYSLYGYKNALGEVVFEARFKDAGDFCEGLAYAKVFEKYGYIDLRGEFVIQPTYDEATDFEEGLAAVAQYNERFDLEWGFIDKSGKLVLPFRYREVMSFFEGRCAVQNKDFRWGFINANAQVVIPCDYLETREFSEGLCAVQNEEGKWGYIDKEGRLVIPFSYEYAESFYEDEAEVRLEKEDGEVIYLTVDKTGNWLD